MKHSAKPFVASLLAGLLLIIAPAAAVTLDDARSRGLVAEKLDGYVAAINKSADVASLVEDINARRADEYTRIAKQNGQSVAVVGKLAAPKIIGGLPKGALYEAENGAWVTR
ncbi:MAG: YdbL family protein [Alphaproteobacteria bacterium]